MKVGSNLWAWKFSACDKKKAYHDEHSANSMAGQQRKRSGHNIQSYKCPFADHWHIGHPKGHKEKPGGPKIYCVPCDRKIPQHAWDNHRRKQHART